MNTQDTINRIEAYINKYGYGAYGWYIGITNDPKRRLKEHDAESTPWIYQRTDSHVMARQVERHFLTAGPGHKSRHFSGGPGGGDAASTFIYAYKITVVTEENV